MDEKHIDRENDLVFEVFIPYNRQNKRNRGGQIFLWIGHHPSVIYKKIPGGTGLYPVLISLLGK